jgi:hypothetical protein
MANLKALVVGDPAGEDHALAAARDEAKAVGEELKALGVACTVLIGPPEDGTGAGLVPGYLPAGYYEVVDLLLSGDFDIVHFAGHANFDTEQADRSGWLFKDGVLTASDLEGMERPPRLIFANACLSAQVAQPNAPQMKEPEPLHFVAGLADQFFRQGVHDYIGAAMEIASDPAVGFARSFYKSLLGGGGAGARPTLGDALQRARKSLFDEYKNGKGEQWTAWRAYQHYGDPTTKFE